MLSKLHIIIISVLLGLLPGMDKSEDESRGMIEPDGIGYTVPGGGDIEPDGVDGRGSAEPDGLL